MRYKDTPQQLEKSKKLGQYYKCVHDVVIQGGNKENAIDAIQSLSKRLGDSSPPCVSYTYFEDATRYIKGR